MNSRLYLYDFDGTLTHGDTMLALARYYKGSIRLYAFFLLYAPLLILMKLGFYSNSRMKEHFLHHFFGGLSIVMFNRICEQFAVANIAMVRKKALHHLAMVNEERARAIIVSASCVNWVEALMRQFDVKIEIVGTELEVENGLITGHLATPNCYGAEKVRRVEALISDRSQLTVIAFGDSRGDKELLQYADESHYKPFRP